MISMIWAMDENNLIGSNNKIPWHIKEDLIYFKDTTKNHTVIMGYNNYLSMCYYYKDRPFPYKRTIVLSNQEVYDKRVEVFNNINDVLALKEDIFIIGGANTYKQFYPYSDYLYISYIKGIYQGDTYIDFLNLEEFKLISQKNTEKVKYTIYKRKKM